MNRLLRRTRSADLDSPPSNPFAPIPARAAPATPAAATPSSAPPAPRRAPVADRGKANVPETAVAPSSSSSAPRAVHLNPPPAAGILRTAGSTPVPRLALGGEGSAIVPHLGLGGSDAGPSSSAGLPPSIAHFFTTKLQLESGNYSRWRQLFYIIACKYEVQHHLDAATEPLGQSAVWHNDDLTMVLWMHGVVAEELMDVVASPASSAHDIWTQLHVLFMDNQPGRAVVLGAEFRNFV